MFNKKIASEVGVGIILLIAIILGGSFWMQSKKIENIKQAPVAAVQKPIEQKPIETSGTVCTQEAKLCSDGKTYVSRTGLSCQFAPCPDEVVTLTNNVPASKNNDNQFSIDNLKFNLPKGLIVAKESDGKIYIKDLNYKSKYDVFLYTSSISKRHMSVNAVSDITTINPPISFNGGSFSAEDIGGAMASYIVDIKDYQYEIVWYVVGNEPIPADNGGLWSPHSSFTSEKILAIMKGVSVE